jgi:hypothetical protein
MPTPIYWTMSRNNKIFLEGKVINYFLLSAK